MRKEGREGKEKGRKGDGGKRGRRIVLENRLTAGKRKREGGREVHEKVIQKVR